MVLLYGLVREVATFGVGRKGSRGLTDCVWWGRAGLGIGVADGLRVWGWWSRTGARYGLACGWLIGVEVVLMV